MIEYVDSWENTYNVIKYIPENLNLAVESVLSDWTQPTLSADGTMGGTSYACSASGYYSGCNPFYAFDGDITSDTRWQMNNVDTEQYYYITFYSPIPLRLEGFQFYNYIGTYCATDYIIQVSNNGTSWIQIKTGTNTATGDGEAWSYITVDVENSYKYIRFSLRPGSTTAIQVRQIIIYAQQDVVSLVLKAGSIITRQDGTEVTMASDVTYTPSVIYSDNEYTMFGAYSSGTIQSPLSFSTIGSGDTLPSTSAGYNRWWLTTDNSIKYVNSSSEWADWTVARPYGVITITNGIIDSIVNTFNGFGFMGQLFYMLPGVQYMTYKDGANTEITVETLQTYQFDSSFSGTVYMIAYADTTLGYVTDTRETDDQGYVIVAQVTVESGKITAMSPSSVGTAVKIAKVTDVVDYPAYLANLLIMQYHNKPKAIATIQALGKMFPVELILAVRDGFSLETAVGAQLDILAKYLGADRYFVNTSGALDKLDDDEFRVLLKLKAVANNTNCSHYDIDNSLYEFFGTSVHAESTGNMEMTYFIPSGSSRTIIAAIQNDCLPRPMGVGVKYVILQSENFFGLVSYSNQYAIYKTGFRTYTNPSKEGECLTYNKVLRILGG